MANCGGVSDSSSYIGMEDIMSQKADMERLTAAAGTIQSI